MRRGTSAVRRTGSLILATGSMVLAACGGGADPDRVCADVPRGGDQRDLLVLSGDLTHAGGHTDRAALCRALGTPDEVRDLHGGQRWTYDHGGNHGVFVVRDDGRVAGSGARFTTHAGR